jgi:hypothetical protein
MRIMLVRSFDHIDWHDIRRAACAEGESRHRRIHSAKDVCNCALAQLAGGHVAAYCCPRPAGQSQLAIADFESLHSSALLASYVAGGDVAMHGGRGV